eukprot:CAMPEP_0184863846 /NCGR_PEP_ID=MMETSP0580-20130426/12786_1 /TAXON_ID=1118495 /ORGANISM="Dactyliosolen fragilissimus" /LENGTH=204 /DNA_ID=CAMNT_0027362417 /DNA_START=143 /DNA_END=757 /DNA_ORIENTATION=+
MSLKPAAVPLLDSGKALARSGELLIDLTSKLDLYGGGLSACGANIRNAGDCVAQAAASCRFKTASELVCDELREAATCLLEGKTKLEAALEEANADQNEYLFLVIQEAIPNIVQCGTNLEAAGASIMKRENVNIVGTYLVAAGTSMELLAQSISSLAPDFNEASESCQRMIFAAERMRDAGNKLNTNGDQKSNSTNKGKAWIKG